MHKKRTGEYARPEAAQKRISRKSGSWFAEFSTSKICECLTVQSKGRVGLHCEQ
jgi:hypothetical protein